VGNKQGIEAYDPLPLQKTFSLYDLDREALRNSRSGSQREGWACSDVKKKKRGGGKTRFNGERKEC